MRVIQQSALNEKRPLHKKRTLIDSSSYLSDLCKRSVGLSTFSSTIAWRLPGFFGPIPSAALDKSQISLFTGCCE